MWQIGDDNVDYAYRPRGNRGRRDRDANETIVVVDDNNGSSSSTSSSSSSSSTAFTINSAVAAASGGLVSTGVSNNMMSSYAARRRARTTSSATLHARAGGSKILNTQFSPGVLGTAGGTRPVPLSARRQIRASQHNILQRASLLSGRTATPLKSSVTPFVKNPPRRVSASSVRVIGSPAIPMNVS